MSYRRSIEQLKPVRTQKVDLQEKVQQILLTESTTFSTSMENVIGSCFQAESEKELKSLMKTYSKDHLDQLAVLDIPMVSKMAKELT